MLNWAFYQKIQTESSKHIHEFLFSSLFDLYNAYLPISYQNRSKYKIGSYKASVNLHAEISANIHIEVVKEKDE